MIGSFKIGLRNVRRLSQRRISKWTYIHMYCTYIKDAHVLYLYHRYARTVLILYLHKFCIHLYTHTYVLYLHYRYTRTLFTLNIRTYCTDTKNTHVLYLHYNTRGHTHTVLTLYVHAYRTYTIHARILYLQYTYTHIVLTLYIHTHACSCLHQHLEINHSHQFLTHLHPLFSIPSNSIISPVVLPLLFAASFALRHCANPQAPED